MNKDGGAGPTNPMLYDPIPEGSVQTTKIMQFVAATAGEKNKTETTKPNLSSTFSWMKKVSTFREFSSLHRSLNEMQRWIFLIWQRRVTRWSLLAFWCFYRFYVIRSEICSLGWLNDLLHPFTADLDLFIISSLSLWITNDIDDISNLSYRFQEIFVLIDRLLLL